MKNVSIFAGHDANITFCNTDINEYHVIELERLVKRRYFRLHVDNDPLMIYSILKECQSIAETFWGFNNEYDSLSVVADGWIDWTILSQVFAFQDVLQFDHHHCHAASAFFQSGFDEALIISYDGGGNDGFFNIYEAKDGNITFRKSIPSDFGGGYLLLASCCSEVAKNSKHMLALAGKMMGLYAYGKIHQKSVDAMKGIFVDRNYKKVSELGEFNLKNVDYPWRDPLQNYRFENQESYDFAANAQTAYEIAFIELFNDLVSEFKPKNICLTGGGALNVLLNEQLKRLYSFNFFVPPNPNDCGLSLGASFLTYKPISKVNIAYNGIPILDKANKTSLLANRPTQPLDINVICQLLKAGKIIGICRDDSEVGPRALGNRSILCDPSFEGMKDILNSKVKFREWYRPFAPICLKEDASKYFVSPNFDNLEFMSYAPLVKDEYKSKLPSITHVDGTSRLQTVTKDSHKFMYDLLTTYKEHSEIPVLLNTSFNIRGNPILTTISDALNVLDTTGLDYVVIDDTLVGKNEVQ